MVYIVLYRNSISKIQHSICGMHKVSNNDIHALCSVLLSSQSAGSSSAMSCLPDLAADEIYALPMHILTTLLRLYWSGLGIFSNPQDATD
jgi:hypothetical protein